MSNQDSIIKVENNEQKTIDNGKNNKINKIKIKNKNNLLNQPMNNCDDIERILNHDYENGIDKMINNYKKSVKINILKEMSNNINIKEDVFTLEQKYKIIDRL